MAFMISWFKRQDKMILREKGGYSFFTFVNKAEGEDDFNDNHDEG